MLCEVCKKEMDISKTEMDITVKERTIKMKNVPCYICPDCQKPIVDEVTEYFVKKLAKRCKEDTYDMEGIEAKGLILGTESALFKK